MHTQINGHFPLNVG